MMGRMGLPELIVLFFLIIPLLPTIFFLLTVQKALSRCAPESRTMTPGQVWLMLIPLFNLVWQFILVTRVASSLGNEFRRRNIAVDAEPGKAIGLAYCILFLTTIIPLVGVLTAIAALVCGIVYWVKIANYSARLAWQAGSPVAAV